MLILNISLGCKGREKLISRLHDDLQVHCIQDSVVGGNNSPACWSFESVSLKGVEILEPLPAGLGLRE